MPDCWRARGPGGEYGELILGLGDCGRARLERPRRPTGSGGRAAAAGGLCAAAAHRPRRPFPLRKAQRLRHLRGDGPVRGGDRGRQAGRCASRSRESSSDGKVQKQAKIDALEWADDEHLLLTLGKTEDFWSRKYEFHQVLVLNLASKKVFWVFAGKSRPGPPGRRWGIRLRHAGTATSTAISPASRSTSTVGLDEPGRPVRGGPRHRPDHPARSQGTDL